MIPENRYPKHFQGTWTNITNITDDIIRFEAKLNPDCDKYRAVFTNGKGDEISMLQLLLTPEKVELLQPGSEHALIFKTYEEAEACIKIKLLTLDDRKFRKWAVDRGDYYWGFGYRQTAKMYATHDADKVVEVDVIVDPVGTYWALYQKIDILGKEDDDLHMIYPNEPCFRVCFPYGPEAEEERGRGKIVKCRVEEV